MGMNPIGQIKAIMNSQTYRRIFLLLATAMHCTYGASKSTMDPVVEEAKQISALLALIRQVGQDARPLDQIRIAEDFGVRTRAECNDFISEQGNVHTCRFLPDRPQSGPIQFVEYETARVGPGPMRGGDVTWKINRRELCLKRSTLVRAFGVEPRFARRPILPDLLPGAAVPEVQNYDFTLSRRQPEDHYVAVFEIGGCVEKLRLSTYSSPG
jgi:hypothetical protein